MWSRLLPRQWIGPQLMLWANLFAGISQVPECRYISTGGLHKTGYVVFDVHGALVHAEGRYNPTAYSTNNVAELSALVMAVEFLVSAAGRAWTLHAQYVEMLGDS